MPTRVYIDSIGLSINAGHPSATDQWRRLRSLQVQMCLQGGDSDASADALTAQGNSLNILLLTVCTGTGKMDKDTTVPEGCARPGSSR